VFGKNCPRAYDVINAYTRSAVSLVQPDAIDAALACSLKIGVPCAALFIEELKDWHDSLVHKTRSDLERLIELTSMLMERICISKLDRSSDEAYWIVLFYFHMRSRHSDAPHEDCKATVIDRVPARYLLTVSEPLRTEFLEILSSGVHVYEAADCLVRSAERTKTLIALHDLTIILSGVPAKEIMNVSAKHLVDALLDQRAGFDDITNYRDICRLAIILSRIGESDAANFGHRALEAAERNGITALTRTAWEFCEEDIFIEEVCEFMTRQVEGHKVDRSTLGVYLRALSKSAVMKAQVHSNEATDCAKTTLQIAEKSGPSEVNLVAWIFYKEARFLETSLEFTSRAVSNHDDISLLQTHLAILIRSGKADLSYHVFLLWATRISSEHLRENWQDFRLMFYDCVRLGCKHFAAGVLAKSGRPDLWRDLILALQEPNGVAVEPSSESARAREFALQFSSLEVPAVFPD
jgi:hypothetical protein